MKPVTIKKSRKSLPLEIANVLIALFPAFCIVYVYDLNIIVFVVAAIYVLFVTIIAFYVIVILRQQSRLVLTDHGIELEDKTFYEWKDIVSYQVEEETHRTFSTETETSGWVTTQTLIVTLRNSSLLRVSLDQIDKKPSQVIDLFNKRKNN